jgi:Na+-transporting NADH:ubiquinone oxidoreductase subunit B
MGLKNNIAKLKKNFEKGAKYEKWMPVFESFETFLFVLGETAPKKGAHIRDAIDLKRTMSVVIIALLPALIFGMWNVGYQHNLAQGIHDAGFFDLFIYGFFKVLPLIIVAYVAGLGTEFVFVYIKQKEIEEGFLVSGLLIPMIVPVDVPLWMVAVATIIAVVFGKEVFGGTGMNVFNPALLTRAILFFAYPSKMSGAIVWTSGLPKIIADGKIADGFTGATPLGDAAGAVGNLEAFHAKWPAFDAFMGWIPGSIGETSTLMILIGALILIATGIGSWKIIVSVFAGGAVMGILLNFFATPTNPYMALPWWEHFVLGGFAFGAVFMATDPVSAAQTEKGKYIYGFLIGFMAILVRVLNPAYPEGVMLAILLLNAFAPLIDHYVVKGHIRRRLNRVKVKQA